MAAYFDVTDVADVPMYSDRQLRDACAKARAEGAEAERERRLDALRKFLPQYVGSIVHGHTADGEPIYATGYIAFPDALVDTFALMSAPDADLLRGEPS